jgi:Zn-dependent alcohol dehydrogenase
VATGICHSDLHMRNAPDRVPKPIVLGHEGAGVVESIGKSVKKVQPGDHVVITFDSCGACRWLHRTKLQRRSDSQSLFRPVVVCRL